MIIRLRSRDGLERIQVGTHLYSRSAVFEGLRFKRVVVTGMNYKQVHEL